jgi:hypothetical protein
MINSWLPDVNPAGILARSLACDAEGKGEW